MNLVKTETAKLAKIIGYNGGNRVGVTTNSSISSDTPECDETVFTIPYQAELLEWLLFEKNISIQVFHKISVDKWYYKVVKNDDYSFYREGFGESYNDTYEKALQLALNTLLPTDVMLDVETLGTDGMFTVLNVTFVPFNIKNGEQWNPFSINIDVKDSEKLGFKSDEDTKTWWKNQNQEIFKKLNENTESIENVTNKIQQFINKNKFVRFWASAPLDYQAISNLFSSVGKKNPIDHKKKFCTRTVRMLHDSEHTPIEIVNDHDPVQDCKNQIEILIQQVKNLELIV